MQLDDESKSCVNLLLKVRIFRVSCVLGLERDWFMVYKLEIMTLASLVWKLSLCNTIRLSLIAGCIIC
ncbi:hypothetical protein HanRHA438_Chr02g0047411 [Helianthus annuus]|nr:hypothetical protein HanRHA438_Chr02g0047411 [Helianthus annuus]